MKKEVQFQINPMILPITVMGLIKNLYKELAKNELGKTLLVGKYETHETDNTWFVDALDNETEVHVKETDHAIHVIFTNIKKQKK